MIHENHRIGKLVKAVRDIPLVRNAHVQVMSAAANQTLPKGTEAEITAVSTTHIEVNCKDGQGSGPAAWGLKLKVAKHAWHSSFE